MSCIGLVRTQNSSLGGGGGADPEAIDHLCLILKIMLSCECGNEHSGSIKRGEFLD
jgi:hypothetical protein